MFEMETTQQMIKHLRLAHSELSVLMIAILRGGDAVPVELAFDYNNGGGDIVRSCTWISTMLRILLSTCIF
jgi:hypothetical protein